MTKKALFILLIVCISSCSLYWRDCDFWSISSVSKESDSFEFSICRDLLHRTNTDLSITEKADKIMKSIEWQGANSCYIANLNKHQYGPSYSFNVICESKINIEDNLIKHGNFYFVGPKITNKD